MTGLVRARSTFGFLMVISLPITLLPISAELLFALFSPPDCLAIRPCRLPILPTSALVRLCALCSLSVRSRSMIPCGLERSCLTNSDLQKLMATYTVNIRNPAVYADRCECGCRLSSELENSGLTGWPARLLTSPSELLRSCSWWVGTARLFLVGSIRWDRDRVMELENIV